MTNIHWLGDEPCHEPGLVGGKAASLSRLAASHRVPAGFAIEALPAASPHALDSLADGVRAAYVRLAETHGAAEPAVAVRSSALDEDGQDASFAGQHDTYLNIRGADAVIEAVRRCVQSASSSEALAYRARRGLSTDDLRIAVLVQQLVLSDVSAVAFSANPITGCLDEIMINSNWGLGESIVGGTCTPDTYIIRKDTLCLTVRDVARKTTMTATAERGTAEASVPEHLQSEPSLSDDQAVEIARLALALERSTGHAVDVECAMARETLYLLQCRPITTLG